MVTSRYLTGLVVSLFLGSSPISLNADSASSVDMLNELNDKLTTAFQEKCAVGRGFFRGLLQQSLQPTKSREDCNVELLNYKFSKELNMLYSKTMISDADFRDIKPLKLSNLIISRGSSIAQISANYGSMNQSTTPSIDSNFYTLDGFKTITSD